MNSGLINSEILSGRISSLMQIFQRLVRLYASVLGGLFLTGFILLMSLNAFTQPVYNWDMIPYLAATKLDANMDIQTVHHNVYSEFQANTDPAIFTDLAEGDQYRMRQSTDAEAFGSMLPMYSVKFLYVELVRFMEPLFGGVESMHFISLFSAILLGVVAFCWLYCVGALALSPVICGLFIVTGVPQLAQSGGPDLLQAAIFVLAMIYIWRSNGKFTSIFAYVLLLIAFAIRPDLLLVLFAFVIASIVWGGRLWLVLITFTSAAAIYPVLTQMAGHPGWWTHFMFSLVTYSQTLVGFDPDFSVFYYARSIVRGLTFSILAQSWLILVVIAVIFRIFAYSKNIKFDRVLNLIFWACILGIMGKFVVFPIPDTRVYIAPLIGIYFALIPSLMMLLKDFQKAPNP